VQALTTVTTRPVSTLYLSIHPGLLRTPMILPGFRKPI
jgi:hypothetical protein